MEVLSPSEIISLAETEIDTLHLPSTNVIPISSLSEDKEPVKGAVFVKLCFTCQAPSKYQCPRCSILSCSLTCVNAHKVAKDCNGVREKTAFVSVDGFKDVHLHSDFHFLEDVQRQLDIAQRAKKDRGLMNGQLPLNLSRLQMAARFRKTDLQILPILFSKRKRSTTYFRYSDKVIFWRIEWEFPHAEYCCYDERIHENTLLGDCLNKYVKENSPNANEQLSYYFSLGAQEITVLLRDERCPANVTRYHILEQNKSLRSNLKYKKIIEYPTLLVISKVHLSSYQIVA